MGFRSSGYRVSRVQAAGLLGSRASVHGSKRDSTLVGVLFLYPYGLQLALPYLRPTSWCRLLSANVTRCKMLEYSVKVHGPLQR